MATIAPTVASPGVTWKASWSKGRLILRHTCAQTPCRGTVKVKLRSARSSKATLRTTKTLGTRTYATATLKLKVSAKVRKLLRKAARRRVSLTVTATSPAAATQSVVLKLPKP